MSDKKKKNRKLKRRLLNIFILICFSASAFLLYQAIATKLDEKANMETYSEIEEIFERSIRENPPLTEKPEPSTEPDPTPGQSEDPVATESPVQTPTPSPSQTPAPTPTPTPTPGSVADVTPTVENNELIPQLEPLNREEIVPYFNDLLDVNEDIRGYIKIPGTVISYPVVQGLDNDFYLERNIYGKKTVSASIFMDYRNNPRNLDDNTIVYGHNLNSTMFNDLDYFVDENTRDSYLEVGGVFRFDTAFEVMSWEIFAAYVIDKDDFNYLVTNFYNSTQHQAFIDRIMELNFIDMGIEVTPDDKILTLSTCNHWFNDSRTVIHARLIKNN